MNYKISELLDKSVLNILTPEESQELNAWREANPEHEQLYQRFHNVEYLRREYVKYHKIDTARPLADMMHRIGEQAAAPRIGQRGWMKYAGIAASLVLLLGLGAYIFGNQEAAPLEEAVAFNEFAEIHHGETKAVLTKANGEQIVMDEEVKAVDAASLVQNEEVSAAESSPVEASEETKEPQMNTLEVPRGGEFKIELEDGTIVWLNSQTQLIYPEQFTGKERRVKVEGEALFKVAKDEKHPFFVETAGQEVRVFGTEFNVRNYPEDLEVQTTLVEGRISLNRIKNPDNCLILAPGHQVRFDKATEEAQIFSTATDIITSWRSGMFVFENQSLAQIMCDLSRWYDFEYEFEEERLANTLFMGSMSRYDSFDKVLSVIEKSGGLKFHYINNKVRISAK